MPGTTALTQEQVPADSRPMLDAFTKNIAFTPVYRLFSGLAALTKGGINAATKSLAIEYAK